MAAPKAHPRWWSDRWVAGMHALHMKGVPCKMVAKLCGVKNSTSVHQSFRQRGLPVRVWTSGHFAPTYKPKSWEQVRGIIAAQTQMCLPNELRYEWRKLWTTRERARFLREMRAHLGIPDLAVRLAGAAVFDASSELARAMMADLNRGLPSQRHAMRLKIPTRGVIFEGRAWFWAAKHGFVDSTRTRTLQRELYERAHGPLPPGMRVRFRDGDPLHLEPTNLYLATPDDVCRENHAAALKRTAAERMTAMLNLKRRKETLNHE